jgi:hypothetical protein
MAVELKKLPTRRGDYYLPHFDLWRQRDATPLGLGLLKRGDAIAALGSCIFSEGVRYLRRRGYRAALYPAGHLYHPASIRFELEHVLGGEPWPRGFVLERHDGVEHRFRKRCTAPTEAELLQKDRRITEQARANLLEADLILMVIGTTTEVWRDEQGVASNEIPPPKTFERGGWSLDPGDLDDIRKNVSRIQTLLGEHTNAHQVYAVCPIPLHATWLDMSVLDANGRSKALLRSALEAELREGSAYLPLWDWVQGQTGRWTPMKKDGRHLDRVGTDRLMLFTERFLSADPVPPLGLRHRIRSWRDDLRERILT